MSQSQQDDFEPQFLEDLRKERREKLFEKETLVLLSLIVVVITVIAIPTVAFVQWQRQRARYNVLENSLRTEASVVSREGKEYSYTFEYLGKTYAGTGKPDPEHRQQADETGTLDVYFLPDNPENNRPVHEHLPSVFSGLRIALVVDAFFIVLAFTVFLRSLVEHLKNRRDARQCLRVIEALTDTSHPVSPRALLEQAEKQGAKKKWLADMREFLMTGCEPISGPQCLWIDSISKWQERWEGGADTRELLRRYAFALRSIYRIRGDLPPIPEPPQLPARIPHDDPEICGDDAATALGRMAHSHALELTRRNREGQYLCDRRRINIDSLPPDDGRGGTRGENPYTPKPGFSDLEDIKHIPYRLWNGHWPREERKEEIRPVGIETILATAFAGSPYQIIESELNGEPTRPVQPTLRIQWSLIKAIRYFFYFPMFAEEPVTREFLVETPEGGEEKIRISYEPARQILFERVDGPDMNDEAGT